MSHPNLHSKSSAKKFGWIPEDYIHLHEWLDETKGWIGDSLHRMFRHHSEGIFEISLGRVVMFDEAIPRVWSFLKFVMSVSSLDRQSSGF